MGDASIVADRKPVAAGSGVGAAGRALRWPLLHGEAARLAWVGAIALFALGLFGRIMTYPLGHDEQGHVTAGRLLFHEPLYQALGYNHFPGLPLLLSAVYAITGTDHVLLAGRLLIFGCWIATAGVLCLIARHHAGPSGRYRAVAVYACLALAGSRLLEPTGMLVTNNFLPVPFALLGLRLFLTAMEEPRPPAGRMFAAGLCVGLAVILKVAFVFIAPCLLAAALVARRDRPFADRLRAALPFVAGGMVGGAPLLFFLLTEPQSLFAHTIRYFTGPHLAYWRQAQVPKAMSLQDKVVIAEQTWLAGAGALSALIAGCFAWTARFEQRPSDGGGEGAWWPVILLVVLVASGAALSFAPTPSFPQYYLPPVPFLIVAVILLHARLTGDARRRALPILWIGSAVCLAIVAPRIAAGLPGAVRPAHWTGLVVHRDGQRLRQAIGPLKGPVATLSPVVALEGGLPIYPSFANGPFVYRLADVLPASDRRWFTTTSERELPAFLDATPPTAIVTGWEEEFDPAFERYARSRGYAPLPAKEAGVRIFVRARVSGPE